MTVNGIISLNLTDQKQHPIGQSHNEKTIFTYSGSIINNGTDTINLKIFIQTLSLGQSETSISIPAGQIVRFRNLKLNGFQCMTANPSVYILATQFLKLLDEGLNEEPEIFYQ